MRELLTELESTMLERSLPVTHNRHLLLAAQKEAEEEAELE